MEMLFLTALLSLLWPDGIRKSLEAVKANTSKKKNREGGVRSTGRLEWWAGKKRRKKRSRPFKGSFVRKNEFFFHETLHKIQG